MQEKEDKDLHWFGSSATAAAVATGRQTTTTSKPNDDNENNLDGQNNWWSMNGKPMESQWEGVVEKKDRGEGVKWRSHTGYRKEWGDE